MIQNIFGIVLPDTNQLVYQIIKTRAAKRTINSAIIMILSFLIRTILYSILALIIMFDNIYIDFFTQCGISILLCSYSYYIQAFTERFDDDLYLITRNIINNFTMEKYKKWQKYITISALIISFIYFWFIEINSAIIRIYIMQYAVCFFFFDVKENKEHYIRKLILPEKKDKNKNNNKNKENFIMIDKNIPNTDYVMIEKKKMHASISSEFDLIKTDDIKKSKSEFELIS
jgi:hypothetical protein